MSRESVSQVQKERTKIEAVYYRGTKGPSRTGTLPEKIPKGGCEALCLGGTGEAISADSSSKTE